MAGAPPEELVLELKGGDAGRQKKLAAFLNGFEGLVQLQIPYRDVEFPIVLNMSPND